MNAAIYLFGTSHSLQCAAPGVEGSKVAAFEAELHHVCEKHAIVRIAEEASKSGLSCCGVECTIGARVAQKLGIEHHNVDLEPEERAALSLDDGPMLNIVLRSGFPDGGSGFRAAYSVIGDAVRERIWIGRILARSQWPTLFVCGADHTTSVEQLWRSLALPVTVVHRDYEP